MNSDFEPRIIAFCCNWCAYAGADLAGVGRLQMPPNFRVIRVMCSGRVDPLMVLKALESGVDGVLVMGCHPGDCHYIAGNYKAERRMRFLGHILNEMGVGERLELHWVSASEGQKFQEVVTDFTQKIQELGPSPLSTRFDYSVVRKEEQKRDQIQELLLSIADQMGYWPERPVEFPEDEVMEGYGFPVVDGDKCMGCGACALNCPESVMQMEDHEGTRSFSHYQYNCRTCRICEEVCPNEAIEIRSGFELSLFLSGEGVKDVDLRMRRCGNCGEFYSADLQLEDIQRRLASGSEDGLIALDLPRELFELCPRCRRDRAAKMVKRRNNKEPMEETAILED